MGDMCLPSSVLASKGLLSRAYQSLALAEGPTCCSCRRKTVSQSAHSEGIDQDTLARLQAKR